jgi:murein L,D-transpeptidase YafK
MGRLFLILGFLSCAWIGAASAGEVPSTIRSINITTRVQPELAEKISEMGCRIGSPIFIRVFKQERELEVWLEGPEGFEHFRTYYICEYSGKLGPKIRTGDGQSPEGFYWVEPSQLNPKSDFHLSFDIGYPNLFDRALGRTGNAVMIHGSCYSRGCFAMTDSKIEEIYTLADAALRDGQPYFQVQIYPFRMTEENMERNRSSRWYPFWSNLKEGYDFFERENRPPQVSVSVLHPYYMFD